MFTKRRTAEVEMVNELIRRAAALISPPEAWIQARQSARADGENTKAEAPDAAQWCCLGALRREALAMCGGRLEGPTRLLYDAAALRLAEALVEHMDCRVVSSDAPTALASWNDADERTQDQVLDLFAAAVAPPTHEVTVLRDLSEIVLTRAAA